MEILNIFGYPRLCFHVENIREVYQQLVADGVEFFYPLQYREVEGGEPIGRVFFHDPDGNILEAMDGRKPRELQRRQHRT